MGASRWSDDFYTTRETERKAKGEDAFAYSKSTKDTKSRDQWEVHEKLSPRGLKTRESRDSEAHPTSTAVAVFFDVTGSMGTVPVVLQKKLPALMNMLLGKKFLEHPAILFGAVGDATCDKAPLQVGQFESGIEMDEDMGRMLIEGGGGAAMSESYELAIYTAARHTAIDCFEKRRKKGYLFLIGDEYPYGKVKAREVNELFCGNRQGSLLRDDILTKDIIAEAREKYHVFCLIPSGASHGESSEVQNAWRDLLGQNVIQLENADNVCETIALAIGLTEGTTLQDGVDAVAGVSNERTARSIKESLSAYAKTVTKAVAIKESALSDIPGSGGAKRL